MKKTNAMYIAEEIAALIGKGILKPREHLVETQLAARFNVSRASIREALLMLEGDRLVQRIPHSGVVVKDFTRKEIHELYDVIYRLEEIAIQKAIQHVAQADIQPLHQILKQQKQAAESGDVALYYDLNEAYHMAIFELSGNSFLTDLYKGMKRSSRPFRMLSIAQGNNIHLSYEEHLRQVQALEAKNVEAAFEAIHEQEQRSLKSLNVLFPY